MLTGHSWKEGVVPVALQQQQAQQRQAQVAAAGAFGKAHCTKGTSASADGILVKQQGQGKNALASALGQAAGVAAAVGALDHKQRTHAVVGSDLSKQQHQLEEGLAGGPVGEQQDPKAMAACAPLQPWQQQHAAVRKDSPEQPQQQQRSSAAALGEKGQGKAAAAALAPRGALYNQQHVGFAGEDLAEGSLQQVQAASTINSWVLERQGQGKQQQEHMQQETAQAVVLGAQHEDAVGIAGSGALLHQQQRVQSAAVGVLGELEEQRQLEDAVAADVQAQDLVSLQSMLHNIFDHPNYVAEFQKL
jgi:hypothetical protein